MGLLDSLRRAFAGLPSAPTTGASVPAAPKPEPVDARVPEVTPSVLMAERRAGRTPLLLDCRENYERRQGYIPGSMHIIMREIPYRLGEINSSADVVVVCAHGNRSYGVAGYLIENGFKARSLRGGIVGWQAQGGEIGHD